MSNLEPCCVIIGSGRTGRGFLAPLVDAGGWTYEFVDTDQSLVSRLASGSTRVRYFGGERQEWSAPEGLAHLAGSPAAEDLLAEADLVVTAVGARNVPTVAAWLVEWARGRDAAPPVVACENGIDVTRSFRELGYPAPAVQAAVFCTTTLDPDGDEQGLVSEDVSTIPFDARQGLFDVPSTFEPRQDFDVLMERKLYTYNALTAVIGYPGALLGEEWLADASQLASVRMLIPLVRQEIDAALMREYGLSVEDQQAFSERALAKFRNAAIADPVDRNTRDVVRKLGPDERIVAPMVLAHKHGIEPVHLAAVLAIAIAWGQRTGEITDVGALECWGALPGSDRLRVDELLAGLAAGTVTDERMCEVISTLS